MMLSSMLSLFPMEIGARHCEVDSPASGLFGRFLDTRTDSDEMGHPTVRRSSVARVDADDGYSRGEAAAKVGARQRSNCYPTRYPTPRLALSVHRFIAITY